MVACISCPFLLLGSIALNECTTVSLSFHLSKDIELFPIFDDYEYSCVNICLQFCVCACESSSLWGKYPGVGLLGHMICVYLML